MSQIRRHSDTPLTAKVQKRLKNVVKKASYSSRYHELRLKGKHPLRLLGTPKDPWAGSIAAGSHIISNRFYCEGQILRNPAHDTGAWEGGEIWQVDTLDQKWAEHLHSFCWLRDLNRVVDRNAARRRAMDLMRHWLAEFDQWHDLTWSPDIIGRRIINWMAYAPLILDSNDLIYRSKLLNCLARQARHLYHSSDDYGRGLPRMRAIGGLILAGLYIPYGENWLKRGTRLLQEALTTEILPDGGVASRNPEDLYRILRGLLVVRASYKAMGHDVPSGLTPALARMTALLKSLIHGDGRLALFHGASEQNAQDMAATIAFSDADADQETGVVCLDGEQSGFRRLEQEGTVIIADTGPPAEVEVSYNGHASTLSFELSQGPHRIIVNCGCASSLPDMPDMDLYKLSRSTAAHSTVVLNDKNSSALRKDGLIGDGPTLVTSDRTEEKGHHLLDMSHDGYQVRFGVTHYRSLYLNDTGLDIRGEDRLQRRMLQTSDNLKAPHFDIRFHVHPDVTVSLQSGDDKVLLRLPNGDYWQFQCAGASLALEESIYLGEVARLQNCRQIVLSGTAADPETVVKWSLRRIERH
ncbi:heparinase II/III family protein [Paremcibacter congregatus]|uniref:Heparinase II/III-like C-terminal domain-containing protein n=1 Tax=Paremcibacter congregatus TaxID=2043170 RepID=A0A2G4YPK2_9PROT|nr:heparinase II/III family protein [Paremcibacter congregatus]PHZ84220.1 hypothetical protein CRD36_13600 [Paremcibacter congregatus]QDE29045.1 hypothetical protein FIV45_18070 [Paremcibacter congregatus]